MTHDDPEMDATDYAHPAWWRGQEAGADGAVRAITKALDGLDDGAGVFGSASLEALRRRCIQIAQERGSAKNRKTP